MLNKDILRSKKAQEIQDEIYYSMPSEKKIRITSQFFMLGKKLKESKTVLENDTRRAISRNS
jgi:hypothetical protein